MNTKAHIKNQAFMIDLTNIPDTLSSPIIEPFRCYFNSFFVKIYESKNKKSKFLIIDIIDKESGLGVTDKILIGKDEYSYINIHSKIQEMYKYFLTYLWG
jgi:hypothetical protein